MQSNYLSYLESVSKKFSEENGIFDIVFYGSALKENSFAHDVDILLLFENEPLKKRVDAANEFKRIIEKKIEKLDIKTANLNELFEKIFLARQGIFIEGYSLVYKKNFIERLGFKGYALFSYNLKNLNNSKKTRFTYALIGRNSEGMAKKTKAKSIGKGAVMVPIEKSLEFEDFLKSWEINYEKKEMLLAKYD